MKDITKVIYNNDSKLLTNNELRTYIKDAISVQESLNDKRDDDSFIKKTTDGQKLKEIFQEMIEALKGEFGEYEYKCSVGIGRLAETPWITIANPLITKNASKGYYIVMLFDRNAKAVHIGLELAWSALCVKDVPNSKELNTVSVAASAFRNLIENEYFIKEFNSTNPVIGKSKRSKANAAALIASKIYRFSEMDSQNIMGDLQMLIREYDSLYKNKIGGLDVLNIIDKYQENTEFSTDEIVEKTQQNYLESIDYQSLSFLDGITNAEETSSLNERVVVPIARSANKTRRGQQEKTGEQGEKIVARFERERLIKEGKPNLANRVKELDTDGDRYDVLSFDADGRERLIEVKSTTTNGNKVTFMISNNELEKSKELDNWYLYLVTNVGESRPDIYYFHKPFGDNKENKTLFNPIATSYKVTVNLKKLGK